MSDAHIPEPKSILGGIATFRMEIGLGSLINLAGIVIVGAGIWFNLVGRVESLEKAGLPSRVEVLERAEVARKATDVQAISKLADVSRDVAAQGRSLAGIERDVQWLVRTIGGGSSSPNR